MAQTTPADIQDAAINTSPLPVDESAVPQAGAHITAVDEVAPSTPVLDEAAAYKASLLDQTDSAHLLEDESVRPAMSPADFADITPVDGGSDGSAYGGDIFQPPDGRVPSTIEDAAAANTSLTLAGATTNDSLSNYQIHRSMNEGGAEVSTFIDRLYAIHNEDIDQLGRELLMDSTVPVEDRLSSYEFAQKLKGIDINIVPRTALHSAAAYQYYDDDTEWADEDADESAESITAIPPEVDALYGAEGTPEEIRSDIAKEINQTVADANEAVRFWSGDTAAMLVPERFQVPLTLIAQDLQPLGFHFTLAGVEDQGVTSGNELAGVFAYGSALDAMRDWVTTLPQEKQLEVMNIMLKRLKPAAGLFKDGNDWVTATTLDTVFSKVVDPEGKVVGHGKVGSFLTTGVNNLGGLMDLIGMGGLARGSLRMGQRITTSLFRRGVESTPELVTKAVAEILSDPTVANKFPGMTVEEVVSSVLPSAVPALQHGGVNGLAEMLQHALIVNDKLLELGSRTNRTAVERAHAYDELKSTFLEMARSPGSTVHMDKTAIVKLKDETGVAVHATFGRTNSRGYGTLGAAKKAMNEDVARIFGEDAVTSLWMKDKATGKLVEVAGDVSDKARGSFFIRAQDTRLYDAAPNALEELTMSADDFGRLGPSHWKIFAGKGAKNHLGWADPNSWLPVQELNRITNTGGTRATVQKLFYSLAEEIGNLSTKQHGALANVLKDSEKVAQKTGKGLNFTPAQLASKGLDDKTIKAYYRYRVANDVAYNVANRAHRKGLEVAGMLDIHGPTGRIGFGKPVAKLEKAIEDVSAVAGRSHMDVFDAVTNTFEKISLTELESLYKAGGKVIKLSAPMLGKGLKEATHIIKRPSDAVTKILSLPSHTMTRIENYTPHMWQGKYMITGMTKGGNRVAIGFAATREEASKLKSSWNARLATREGKGKKTLFAKDGIDYHFDRQLDDVAGRAGNMAEQMVQRGGPIFGTRNWGRLRNFSPESGDIMVDPIESLMRGMEIISHRITSGELASQMRTRLGTFTRAHGLSKDPRVTPRHIDDLVGADKASRNYKIARDYMQQIDLVERVPDPVKSILTDVYRTFGEGIENVGAMIPRLPATVAKTVGGKIVDSRLEKLAGTFKQTAKFFTDLALRPLDPSGLVMGYLHRAAISAAPVSQFALQLSQSAILLGISPKQYAKSAAHLTAFSTLVATRVSNLEGKGLLRSTAKEYRDGLKAASKMTGMPVKEVEQLVDIMVDRGLVTSTAHSTMLRQSVRTAGESIAMSNARVVGGNTLTRLSRIFKKGVNHADAATFGVGSKVGFEAGENLNRILTLLTVYNKDKAAGKAALNSEDYVKGLMGKSISITGSMMPELSFGFQRGFLKNAAQFISFQAKMATMMMPATIFGGSRRLTGWEKGGMVISQTLLFGRRGAPHVDLLYRTIDNEINKHASTGDPDAQQLQRDWMSPEVREVVRGGMVDYFGNMLINACFDNENNTTYSFADRFAPGGGFEFATDRVVSLANADYTALGGLGLEKTSKLFNFLKYVGDVSLAQAKGMDKVDFGDRAVEIMQRGGAELFGIYGKYLSSLTAENVGNYVSAGGIMTDGLADGLERNLFTYFGVVSNDRQELYDLNDKYREELATDPQKLGNELADLEQRIWKETLKFHELAQRESGGREDYYDTLAADWNRQQGLLLANLPPEQLAKVSESINSRISALVLTKPSQATAITSRVTKYQNEMGRAGDASEMLNRMQMSPTLQKNPRLMQIIHEAWVNSITPNSDEEQVELNNLNEDTE